ncbi:MAG TPA: NAD(P)H-dependent oxidoreductase [Pseudonocardiaceae bacterium]
MSITVVVIVGSTRTGRLAPEIARWFTGQLGQRDDMVVDVVDLLDAPETAALRPRIAAADAFVLVVPEYNRSIPGPLKTLIDCYNAEWEAKPVGFVAYGLSMAGGVRAVEHLRQIFAEFHCVGMKDIVTFPRILDHFDPDGHFTPDLAGCNNAAKIMLDQLGWWANALRDAKAKHPYRS